MRLHQVIDTQGIFLKIADAGTAMDVYVRGDDCHVFSCNINNFLLNAPQRFLSGIVIWKCTAMQSQKALSAYV